MCEQVSALGATIFSVPLCVYWMYWAWVLVTVTDAGCLRLLLDRESERLRCLLVESLDSGTLLLQWIDYRILTAWYRINRQCGKLDGYSPEDLISILGRFGDFQRARFVWSLSARSG